MKQNEYVTYFSKNNPNQRYNIKKIKNNLIFLTKNFIIEWIQQTYC